MRYSFFFKIKKGENLQTFLFNWPRKPIFRYVIQLRNVYQLTQNRTIFTILVLRSWIKINIRQCQKRFLWLSSSWTIWHTKPGLNNKYKTWSKLVSMSSRTSKRIPLRGLGRDRWNEWIYLNYNSNNQKSGDSFA